MPTTNQKIRELASQIYKGIYKKQKSYSANITLKHISTTKEIVKTPFYLLFSGTCICFIVFMCTDILRPLSYIAKCNHYQPAMTAWYLGLPITAGNTARGASSHAKPALHIPDPLSSTTAATSSL